MKSPLSISRALGNVVVTLHGEVDAVLLDHALSDLADGQGNLHLIIDLRDAGSIDEPCLTVLTRASERVRERGGDLTLNGPQERVHETLQRAGLTVTEP
ncbi:MAG TPA: STAS domain-containing protein [Acidimicrobiales bacterium]|nr:STAS domain-containing protein [Acidimicrobiales bacterium]